MLEWSDDLSVGIEDIDRKHRELLAELKKLQASVLRGKAHGAATPALRFLIDYAERHFTEEEALMAVHAYPARDDHRVLHNEFRDDCRNLLQRLENESEASRLSVDLCYRLTEWLYTHISKVDQEMGSYLRGKMEA